MLDRIRHRGPDDRGWTRSGPAWLGHRRLSIVDVDGGHQPLSTPDGSLQLVGNGEIYNHETLRSELHDQQLSTRSDNEVALRLFAELGTDAFARLQGMWALAVAGLDPDGREVFVVARDPVGIKPLYWARRGDEVLFASEIAAFDDDWRPLVSSFPPGHWWTPEDGLHRFARAVPARSCRSWPAPADPDADPPSDVLDAVRERLIATVERQLMGDVEVGVLLSGGLDSSLVAAIAARSQQLDRPLPTFAVGMADSPDLLAAREVARHLGTEHHEHVFTAAEAQAIVPDVVRAIESYDPSLVRSAVANYLVAELAARRVKVVLTGEGADEIFAGYAHYQEISGADDLHAELVRNVENLHDLNLQRCDRVTMAHGLEARVPFLELDLIDLGLSLPAAWKISRPGWPEKRLLREAFDGWLPEHLLWRTKAQFGDGSGMASVLTDHLSAQISDDDFTQERHATTPGLRTKEELAYYRIFAEHLDGVRPEATISLFATA